ncbi:MAG: ABC transporter permease [Gammaproteobacteria bacterium]|nr:ABC transporter permease [Gammaproteobacteria bacterium]
MSTAVLASIRYYGRHPWQLILAVFGIALGSGMVIAIELATGGAQRAFDRSLETLTGTATHRIVGHGGAIDEEIYVALRLAGFRNIAPLVEAYGRARGETLHLLGVDPFVEGGFRDHLRGGRGDAGELISRPTSAFISAATAARLGVSPGAALPIEIGGRQTALTIIDTLDSDEVAGIDGLVLTDIATAQELAGMIGRLSWIDVRLPGGEADAPEHRALAGALPASVALVPAESRGHALRQMASAFHTNLRAMSLLALLVGSFLVYSTMRFAVIQRRERFGLMRLAGVTRRGVLVIVLCEALLIGALGTLLGLAGGIILGESLLGLVTRTISDLYFTQTVTQLEIAPEMLLRGAVPGILATLAAALVPAREAATAAPAAVLRRSVLEERSRLGARRGGALAMLAFGMAIVLLSASDRSLLAAFAGLFLFVLGIALLVPLIIPLLVKCCAAAVRRSGSAVVHLALAGIPASISRTGVAVAALTIAVAAAVGVGLMIASFRVAVDDWLQATLQADIYVSAPSSGSRSNPVELDAAIQQRLLDHPAVAAHTTGRLINLETAAGVTELFVLGLPADVRPWHRLSEALPDAWARFRAGDGVLVSQPYAWHHRVAAGDRITLPTRHGTESFVILAVYRDYRSGQGQVLMPRSLYLRIQDDAAIGSLGLYLAPGADAEAVLRELRDAVSTSTAMARVQSGQDLRALSLTIFDRTFTVTEVLRVLALLAAIAGMLGAMLALQLERRAVLATLRTLGMTPGDVFRLVIVQTGVLGALAGLLALPTGIILAILLVKVINLRSFGWTMPIGFDAAVLTEGLAAALVTALIAGVYPAWRAARATPAAALRNE